MLSCKYNEIEKSSEDNLKKKMIGEVRNRSSLN